MIRTKVKVQSCPPVAGSEVWVRVPVTEKLPRMIRLGGPGSFSTTTAPPARLHDVPGTHGSGGVSTAIMPNCLPSGVVKAPAKPTKFCGPGLVAKAAGATETRSRDAAMGMRAIL